MSEELLACRVCLATEVKLYDMHQNKLVKAYEFITGSKMSTTDSLPSRICSYCGTLLLKYTMFQERCLDALRLLHEALVQDNLITTSYIHSIDRNTRNLTLPYSIKVSQPHEVNFDEKLNIKSNEDSDDERPRSKINIKPRKRRKKKKSGKNTDIDNVSVKIENDDDFGDTVEDLNNDFDMNQDMYKHNDRLEIEDNFVTPNIKHQENDFDTTSKKLNIKVEDSDDEQPLSKINKKSRTNCIDEEMDKKIKGIVINDDVEVITLSRQDQINEILARKESANYKNSFYKCDICYKGFITEITFKNHMERHDPRSGEHVCEVCGSRWPNARTLRAHEQTSHLRRYRCKLCNHVSRSGFKAREHGKWHQGVRYVCGVCGASFDKSTSHLTHVRLRHGGDAQCALCGARLLGECGLRAHMRKAHKFQDKQSRLHCATCKTTFKTPEALAVHRGPSGGAADCAAYKWCAYCGSGFDSREGLQVHAATHSKEFACRHCTKLFSDARALSQHCMRAHSGAGAARARAVTSQPCVCEVCGHTCTSKATLVCHLRTHTGEKPYQCTACPKRFSVYQRLQIHIRTHTGERPFKCPFCPKAFKHKAALNRHDRVHTGVKPYECVHCGKAFSQSNSLKGHVRTVHLKMPPPYRNRKRVE